MRELLADWFGPVLDANGRRVKWRTNRPALTLMAAAVTCAAATATLVALYTFTDSALAPWWPATCFASLALNVAATRMLRASTHSCDT